MKIFKTQSFATQIMVILFAITLSNCSVQVGHNRGTVKAKQIPPGQAKKMAGQKSAKNFAPGHN